MTTWKNSAFAAANASADILILKYVFGYAVVAYAVNNIVPLTNIIAKPTRNHGARPR